jgi:hypothetical protein
MAMALRKDVPAYSTQLYSRPSEFAACRQAMPQVRYEAMAKSHLR